MQLLVANGANRHFKCPAHCKCSAAQRKCPAHSPLHFGKSLQSLAATYGQRFYWDRPHPSSGLSNSPALTLSCMNCTWQVSIEEIHRTRACRRFKENLLDMFFFYWKPLFHQYRWNQQQKLFTCSVQLCQPLQSLIGWVRGDEYRNSNSFVFYKLISISKKSGKYFIY